MAKGIRELRRRIRGVKNIAQITRAMEMVASTKLKRLQERAEGSKPYRESLQAVVARLADKVSAEDFPLLKRADKQSKDLGSKQTIGILVVSADKGLCGAYNSNVFRAVQSFARAHAGAQIKVYVLGSRGKSFFTRNEPKLTEAYDDGLEKIPFTRVRVIVRALARLFVTGELSELHLVSTRFLSASQQKPEAIQLLPIDPATLALHDEAKGGEFRSGGDPILEPSPAEIFSRLLPKYLEVQVYGAVAEALASEFAMRRMAMKAATDAAKDMIGSLTRQYNRARQETITKELLEIIGGAEALKG